MTVIAAPLQPHQTAPSALGALEVGGRCATSGEPVAVTTMVSDVTSLLQCEKYALE